MEVNIPPNENKVILNVDRGSEKHITLRDLLPLIDCDVRLVIEYSLDLVIEADNGLDLMNRINEITVLDVEKVLSAVPSISVAVKREEMIGKTLYEQKRQVCIFV